MAQFQATVRLYDVVDEDLRLAHQTVEQGLRTAGFRRWQIAHIGLQGAVPVVRSRPRQPQYAGGLLIVAGAAWVLWVLWMFAS